MSTSKERLSTIRTGPSVSHDLLVCSAPYPLDRPASLHDPPFAFAPTAQNSSQCLGYKEMIDSLHDDLAKITGFAACSGQPNSGAQGEYAGLLSIRSYHQSRGDHDRNICIIPVSAHGTNPASAVLAGMKVVVVKSDDKGNIDIEDLRTKVWEMSMKCLCVCVFCCRPVKRRTPAGRRGTFLFHAFDERLFQPFQRR